jgi:two-component system response regulator HydG
MSAVGSSAPAKPVRSAGPVPFRVLVVDDEDVMRKAWRRILTAPDFTVELAARAEEALAALERSGFDVVVLDIVMPGMSGLEALPIIKRRWPEIEVVMTTAFGGVDGAFEAVRQGAYQYLAKPFESIDSVELAVRNAACHKRLAARARHLEEELRRRDDEARGTSGEEAERWRMLRRILGDAPAIKEVVRAVEAVAGSSASVLVQGESGTGKELVARVIHGASTRRGKPFLTANCSALPGAAIESELFGHRRGAFPGAATDKVGLLQAASGGTLFLDEISEITPALQAKLLAVLLDGEVRPVGSSESERVDLRVVAASSQNLVRRLAAGTFLEDLYNRLAVVTIAIPALRDRRGDVPLLAYHFLRRAAERAGKPLRHITPDALEALTAFSWPGNVRELETVIERAVALGQGEALTTLELPPALLSRELAALWVDGERPVADSGYRVAKTRALRAFDRVYVQTLLERTRGNISESARLAGLDRSNFRRVIKRAGLDD